MAYGLCRARVETRLPLARALKQLFEVSQVWDGIGDHRDKWLGQFAASLFGETIHAVAEPNSAISVLVALEAKYR